MLGNKKLDNTGEKNPDYGKLFAISYNLSGEEERIEVDIKKDTFFLARIRVQIKCKQTDPDGKPLYWAREVDNADDWIKVMDKTNTEVAEGMYRDLKDEYGLKFTNAAYVWFKGKIYRWVVSGAHFESWFALTKKAFKGVPRSFRVSGITENSVGNGTVWYNVLSFEWADEFPLEEAVKIADLVDGNLSKYYDSLKKPKITEGSFDELGEAELTDLPF